MGLSLDLRSLTLWKRSTHLHCSYRVKIKFTDPFLRMTVSKEPLQRLSCLRTHGGYFLVVFRASSKEAEGFTYQRVFRYCVGTRLVGYPLQQILSVFFLCDYKNRGPIC